MQVDLKGKIVQLERGRDWPVTALVAKARGRCSDEFYYQEQYADMQALANSEGRTCRARVDSLEAVAHSPRSLFSGAAGASTLYAFRLYFFGNNCS